MLSLHLVRIRRLRIRKVEHSRIDNRLDSIRLNGAVHINKLRSGTNIHAAVREDAGQLLKRRPSLSGCCSEEADLRDRALNLDGLEGLRERGLAA